MIILGIQIIDPPLRKVGIAVVVSCGLLAIIGLTIFFGWIPVQVGTVIAAFSMGDTICRLYGITYQKNGIRGAAIGGGFCAVLVGLGLIWTGVA